MNEKSLYLVLKVIVHVVFCIIREFGIINLVSTKYKQLNFNVLHYFLC